MPNFTPLGNRVLIKQREAADKIGSLLIPDKAQRKPLDGVVIAVGPGKRTEDGTLVPTAVKVNDFVILAPQTGNEVVIEGEKFIIVNDDDILGVAE